MRYRIITVASIILISIFHSSCSEKVKIRRMMQDFIESEIHIPNDLECIFNRELTTINKDELKSNKLIIYYDSLDCSSCRISHLMDIYPLYDMSDTCDFSVVTIFSPKKENLEEVKFQLSIANHPEHIYIDSFNTFRKINQHIPTDQRFHSFLVDSNGKPIFVGNPLSNMRLAEIFHDIIQSEATNQK